MNIFLYDNKLDLGIGTFASVGGFRLVTEGRNRCLEAIKDDDEKIYGYIYEIDNDTLGMLDMYYGLGLDLHERITVVATLEGGSIIIVDMYEYNMELV